MSGGFSQCLEILEPCEALLRQILDWLRARLAMDGMDIFLFLEELFPDGSAPRRNEMDVLTLYGLCQSGSRACRSFVP